ncbi:hypothetical protein LTR56_004283 [Elasticomyces elasticus]|nr:hypothetical protein LTR56_004283 [Elasticomyces elasticus]KAK5749696.1 hypothetical protein LTS12_020265 [Elasticomyces elasticus]
MSFESMHTSGEADLKAYIKDSFGTYEGFDRQKVGHFVWARGMYHLCGLMLYHPLTLYRHRLAYGQGFPTTFAREIMSRCRNHLARLTDLLAMVLSTGCCARGSFLGYMAAQAAIAHKLFSHSLDQDVATRSHTSLVTCTQFLIQPAVCWASNNTMAAAVNDYDIEPDLAQCLIDVASPPMLELKSTQMDRLRGIVDYAWLSDSDRAKFLGGTPAFNFDASVGDWPTQFGFDDPSSFFMVASTSHPLAIRCHKALTVTQERSGSTIGPYASSTQQNSIETRASLIDLDLWKGQLLGVEDDLIEATARVRDSQSIRPQELSL